MDNHYETVFIVNPVLSDDQVKETVDKFEGLLKEKGGKIVNSEYWGLRKLAYPIEKKRSGFYHLMEYTVNTEAINPLEIEMRRDERIMRFLTVKLDKFGVEYATRRKKRVKSKKEEA